MPFLGSPSLHRPGHVQVPQVFRKLGIGRGGSLTPQRCVAAAAGKSCPTVLIDHHQAKSTEQLQAHIETLVQSCRQGKPVTLSMLATFQRISANNRLGLLLDRQYFEALLPALYRAKDSIHIAMLTFDDSLIGQAIADLLIEKMAHNPQMSIRVIYDGYGSGTLTPFGGHNTHVWRMRQAGIHLVCNNVFAYGLEHRKLVVIDGVWGFFGGACLSKPYYGSRAFWRTFDELCDGDEQGGRDLFLAKAQGRSPRRLDLAALDAQPDLPEYHDFAYQCCGEVVAGLQASFLQTWLLHRQTLADSPVGDAPPTLDIARYFPAPRFVGTTLVKLTHSVPGGASQMGIMLLEGVRAAQHTLDVNFAYILVPQFVDALTAAGRRGVKIRILVPSYAGIDLPAAYYAFAAQYSQLLRTQNVEIFEFKQYTHLKFMVADHRFVFTSTGNPEWDSWQRAFDEIVLLDSPRLAKIVDARVFAVDLAPARATGVSAPQVAAKGLMERLRQHTARLLFDTFFRVTPGGVTLERAKHPHYVMVPKLAAPAPPSAAVHLATPGPACPV